MDRSMDTYLDFNIGYCDPRLDNSCLSFDEQASIFKQSNFWRLTLINQEVDLKSREIINIPQDYYFLVS